MKASKYKKFFPNRREHISLGYKAQDLATSHGFMLTLERETKHEMGSDIEGKRRKRGANALCM